MKITPVGDRTFKSPTPAALDRLKRDVRRGIMNWITDYVRHRVRDEHLQKGRTPIEGYSTNPLVIPWKGKLKPHKTPRGGKSLGTRGMYFPGGYLEYRMNLGLGAAFSFYNTGDAWRDWKTLLYGDESTPGEIGWTKPENAIAANAAEEKRPDLFFVDESELTVLHTKVVDLINLTFFGSQKP